eukprot:s524_g28.t1
MCRHCQATRPDTIVACEKKWLLAESHAYHGGIWCIKRIAGELKGTLCTKHCNSTRFAELQAVVCCSECHSDRLRRLWTSWQQK